MSGAEQLHQDTTSENRPEVEQLGDQRYAVTRRLGEGSQGETLEAVDKRDGRLVAIKRFRIKGAESWKSVELAEREARVLSSLEHPLLPRYIEHFEENGALCLVMEKVEGTTLRELSRRGALDQHAVVRLLNDVADVLDYLHLRAPPIIHRDIKPSNIICRPDGRFGLVDFGSVRERLKPEGGSTVVGTFGFMAPEQFQGRALPASDVYGLGATALAALTSVAPDELPHRGLAIDVEQALGGQVDSRLTHVLAAMLRPDPEMRCSRLSELLAEQRLRLTDEQRAAQPSGTGAGPREGFSSASRRAPSRASGAGVPGSDGWIFHNAFVVPLMLLGLEVGKLATWALFSVSLPILFGVLSIFFGRPLRRAAVRVDYLGKQARRGMTLAAARLRERADGAAARRHERRHARRVRVAPGSSRTRIAAEELANEHEVTEASESARTRASGR